MDGVGDDVLEYVGDKLLGDRPVLLDVLLLVDQLHRVLDQAAARHDLRGHAREHVLDHLELEDGAAELLAAIFDLRSFLDDDSTFFGDLFAHVVSYKGDLYLETGLHRALRAALQGRTAIHARILEVTEDGTPRLAPAPPTA